MSFRNRREAGRRLGEALVELLSALGHADPADQTVVVGLPRGGVPVAYEVARRLQVPLDVLLVRKLGLPSEPELAVGAIAEGGIRILDERATALLATLDESALAAVERRAAAEMDRQARRFRDDRPPLPVADRTVVVVDDGIATGSTARAACHAARGKGARFVVLATPVAPPTSIAELAGVADRIMVSQAPSNFSSVGAFYEDFSPTTDEEVVALLEEARRASPPAS